MPSVPLIFIFVNDLWHTFALTLHVLLHKNYILVWEGTPGIIYQKFKKITTLSISLGFNFATHYGTLSLLFHMASTYFFYKLAEHIISLSPPRF